MVGSHGPGLVVRRPFGDMPSRVAEDKGWGRLSGLVRLPPVCAQRGLTVDKERLEVKIRCCVMVALTMLLMAGLVVPSGAADDPGGRGDRVAAAGGFSDVSGVHAPAVEALAAEGVLDGTDCGAGLFCPDQPLLRSVMAVWVVRMLDGADTAPTASDVFSDVDYSKEYAPFADRLADLAVTRGCAVAPLRYCPDDNVTRGQMAAFLVRAFDLEAGPNAGFTDVGDGHTFAADIDALAASRVTAGCSTAPLRFCPDRHVTRAQMATFLARAAGMVELPAPVGAQPGEPPVFDPFTTPTVSDIDLQRLGEAVATLDPDADVHRPIRPSRWMTWQRWCVSRGDASTWNTWR